MPDHTYHKLFDDDSGKWLVLNDDGKLSAGPFSKAEQAEAWIGRQLAIDEWTDS